MNNQRILTKLFVEELRKRNVLEDVICEYCIENVRECMHCHKLMNEGWMFAGVETYCSDKCLRAAHPEIDIETYRAIANDEDSDTYWTSWGD